MHLYRFYITALSGILTSILTHIWWVGIPVFIITRTLWFLIERAIANAIITRDIKLHLPIFRSQFGPYGVRIANLAETDPRIRRSLAEVFVANPAALKKSVDQLEMINTLFNAGMRPEGDEFLLHDLKLKYGRSRMEKPPTQTG